MKNILLASLLVFSTIFSANAQEFEGEITFRISYKNLPEEVEKYKAFLPKKTKVLIKNHKSKVIQNMMGLMSMKIISNTKSKETIVLMKGMGQKIAMKNKTEETVPQNSYTVTKKEDIKIIAGYKCNKAILTDTAGNIIIYWYTTSIPSYNNQNLPNISIEGFPMEYSIVANGMHMKMTVSKINKKEVKDSEFEIPEGYEMKSPEEMEKLMKGMEGIKF